MAQITVYEKPVVHKSLADWNAKQWQIQQTNNTRLNDSFNLRNDTRRLRNELNIKTTWDTYFNNCRLADRITEEDRWRDIFQTILDRINYELNMLKDTKFEAEKDLDALSVPLSIISESLSSRDMREGEELTFDEVETEMKKELCVIESVKKTFIDRLQAVWEKINKLNEVRYIFNVELSNKTEGIAIDNQQLELTKNHASLSFKTDPLRVVKNSITYEEWLEHNQYLKTLGENELAGTNKLREALFLIRNRAKNDIKAQRDRVNFILRKRIFQTQKARNELEWQQRKMREEMDRMMEELKVLSSQFDDKVDACKLAETRLENRSYRPSKELARDEPEDGLKQEVMTLRDTVQKLKDQAECLKATFNALSAQAIIIDRDLECKNQSLMIDIRSLDSRARLQDEECELGTDRNIKLTKMEDELPKK